MSLWKTLGLLVHVPLDSTEPPKGLPIFTEASALLCKAALMFRICCLPSQVLVTFDEVLLAQ